MINSNKLKGRIIEMGLSQSLVANALGISQPTLSQKINNLREMDLSEAEKLADLLRIPDSQYGDYFFYNPVA
jgi:transcriptional regulator with XRE-family HTH domain